tara:strand:- start:319 stop:459 length:141 start_codon:yes stop_codon:yes gene_type:complete
MRGLIRPYKALKTLIRPQRPYKGLERPGGGPSERYLRVLHKALWRI